MAEGSETIENYTAIRNIWLENKVKNFTRSE